MTAEAPQDGRKSRRVRGDAVNDRVYKVLFDGIAICSGNRKDGP